MERALDQQVRRLREREGTLDAVRRRVYVVCPASLLVLGLLGSVRALALAMLAWAGVYFGFAIIRVALMVQRRRAERDGAGRQEGG